MGLLVPEHPQSNLPTNRASLFSFPYVRFFLGSPSEVTSLAHCALSSFQRLVHRQYSASIYWVKDESPLPLLSPKVCSGKGWEMKQIIFARRMTRTREERYEESVDGTGLTKSPSLGG